jgi:hypothetical protein
MSGRDAVRPAIAAVIAAAIVAGVLWFVGVQWPFAVAAGIIVLAAAVVWAVHGGTAVPLYATPHTDPRPGTRSEVMQTAWSLRGRHGEIGDAGAKRLRVFARRRLERHGRDLDDPADADAIRALVGESAWATLAGRAPIRLPDVEHCLDRLDSLDDTGGHPQ